MKLMIMAAIFIIAVLVLSVILRRFKTPTIKKEQLKPRPETVKEQDPGASFKQILDTLIKLNLMVRTDRHCAMNQVQAIEVIIDDIKVLIPDMMERYPGETLTYELKKIGATHLHKTVKEYLDLSPESRETQKEAFEKTIESLHDVCARSRQIVENNETAEFKTMAHFLEGKFS